MYASTVVKRQSVLQHWSNYQIRTFIYKHICYNYIYRMAGNFAGKIFWRIAENMLFGGIYFGG